MGKTAKKQAENLLKVQDSSKPELRQVAALPLRVESGLLRVCLITTRQTRRWTIPKGWPMKDVRDSRAAAIEAEQEAGLQGKIGKAPVGEFLYWKRQDYHFDLVRVFVYKLNVTGSLPVWREMGQREVRWFTLRDAALLVEEPGLSALMTHFAEPLPADEAPATV